MSYIRAGCHSCAVVAQFYRCRCVDVISLRSSSRCTDCRRSRTRCKQRRLRLGPNTNRCRLLRIADQAEKPTRVFTPHPKISAKLNFTTFRFPITAETHEPTFAAVTNGRHDRRRFRQRCRPSRWSDSSQEISNERENTHLVLLLFIFVTE